MVTASHIVLEDVINDRHVTVNPPVDQWPDAACLLPAETKLEH